jgi:hypothetical protein
LVNVTIAANEAFKGGGLAAENDAVITMEQDAASCSSVDDCSRLTGVSSVSGLRGSATLISTLDPQFRNALAGDLRVGFTSPAIDFCDATLFQPTHTDRDGENRGYDVAGNANGSPGLPGGLYDLGADEVRDLLLVDGFESGNTALWSGQSP